MSNGDLEKFAEAIRCSGFCLEYRASSTLQKHGWSVLNNRYYVDAETSRAREMDIIAYKALNLEKEETIYYTVLIISCKKSEANNWGFLTKGYNKPDPNINFYPVSNWTSDRALRYCLSEETWKQEFRRQIDRQKMLQRVYAIDNQVFAFQEMDRKSGKIYDDKAIYDSVSSLVKAHYFEVANLESRIKNTRFYNFNLISVAETTFVELHFDEKDKVVPKPLNEIKYLNRFIVGKEDDFYRIHFVTSDHFEEVLSAYDLLAEWNADYCRRLTKRFYETVFNDDKKTSVFLNDFKENLVSLTKSILLKRFGSAPDCNIEGIYLDTKKSHLHILMGGIEDNMVTILNENKLLAEMTKRRLLRWYRYSGSFEYERSPDLPF